MIKHTAEVCSRLLVLTSSAAVKHVTPERAAQQYITMLKFLISHTVYI